LYADKHGQAPLAGGNYTFWRNIKDYGAKGDDSTDDAAAINRAVATGGRCGEDCGNSFSLGAIVYFPVCKDGDFSLTALLIVN